MPSSVRNPAIVVGVDSSENALLALDWAVDEAARRDCPIRLVHAYRPSGPGHDLGRQAVMVEMYAEGQNVFASAREHMAGRREAGRVVGTALHEGSPGTVLADLTAGAPMCVIGRRGRVRLTSFVLGSTALDLASRSGVPLVVVPPEWRRDAVDRKPVLVGVDLPLRHPDALAFAFAAAERSAVPLVALCAWDLGLSRLDGIRTDGMRTGGMCTEVGQILADLLAQWQQAHPSVEMTAVAEESTPAEALVSYSAEASLIVLGGGFGFGARRPPTRALARSVLRESACPVALVPGPTPHTSTDVRGHLPGTGRTRGGANLQRPATTRAD